jgi:hypothetical protein
MAWLRLGLAWRGAQDDGGKEKPRHGGGPEGLGLLTISAALRPQRATPAAVSLHRLVYVSRRRLQLRLKVNRCPPICSSALEMIGERPAPTCAPTSAQWSCQLPLKSDFYNPRSGDFNCSTDSGSR